MLVGRVRRPPGQPACLLTHCAAVVLVLANKQDLHGALPVERVKQLLDLDALKDRPHHIMRCCAITGDGLKEGFEWLAHSMPDKKS